MISSHAPRAVFGALLASSAAVAQVSMTLATGNDWTAIAYTASSQTVPAGTPVSGDLTLSATDTTFCTPGSATLSLQSTATTVSLSASASRSFVDCAPSALVDALLHVTLTAPTPTFVLISATSSMSASGTFPSSPRVTVLDSGAEFVLPFPGLGVFSASGSDQITVPAGPGGTTIEVRVRARAVTVPFSSVETSNQCSLSISPLGPAPALTTIGVRCGPEMDASVSSPASWGPQEPSIVALDVMNVPPWPAPFFVLGVADVSIPIPPLNCPLLTDILAPLGTPIGLDGTARLTVPIVPSIGSADVRFQFLVGDVDGTGTSLWQTSNAIRVQL